MARYRGVLPYFIAGGVDCGSVRAVFLLYAVRVHPYTLAVGIISCCCFGVTRPTSATCLTGKEARSEDRKRRISRIQRNRPAADADSTANAARFQRGPTVNSFLAALYLFLSFAGASRRRTRSSRRCRCTAPVAGNTRATASRRGRVQASRAAAGWRRRRRRPPACRKPVASSARHALDDQRVDHRVLEAARDVGARLLAIWSLVAPAVSTAVFRPLKLKSRSGAVSIGRGNLYAPASPCSASAPAAGPPGYRRPEQLGGLVERFAGGVVEGLAEQRVAADAVDRDQLGVAARDQQRHERKGGRVGSPAAAPAGGLPGDGRRSPARPAPGQRRRRRRRRPAARPPAPGPRVGDAVEVAESACRLRPGSAASAAAARRTWSREASSGTTPPYSACRATWLWSACASRPSRGVS